jgi:hypothetical protein
MRGMLVSGSMLKKKPAGPHKENGQILSVWISKGIAELR